MKKKLALLATGALVASASWQARPARAADHLDGSTFATTDAAADITDIYAWMSGDGGKVYLVMNLSFNATSASKFSDAVKYVFHTTSSGAFGAAGAPSTVASDIICTFSTAQAISCWLQKGATTLDYVTGNASATTGITSVNGKLKVFAGLRDDPFFFNLDGFNATRSAVIAAKGSLTFDAAGCPKLDAATSSTLVNQLKSGTGGAAASDFFANKNVLSIVIAVDKATVTSGGKYFAVWGATTH